MASRRLLYLDCQAGAAGDMLAAALLDLSDRAAEAELRDALASLGLEGWSLEVSRVAKGGVDCCDFKVVLDEEHENHDHDMDYLHGDAGRHHHAGHGGGHEHRCLHDIEQIIGRSSMAPYARDLALRAFSVLAQAEAEAHGVPVDEVHFHEVGAVDSIIDIVSVAFLFDRLRVDGVVVPALVDGCGTVRCQHGVIPVPVPATLAICAAHSIPLTLSRISGELVTPTGAALIAALDPVFEPIGRVVVQAVGIGAGKRSYEAPSMLRAMVVAQDRVAPSATARDEVVKLECDIDDATAEQLAYAAEQLREEGALEVHWISMLTKKGRPAHQLQVICRPADAGRLERTVFLETTTIGVRRTVMERTVLEREEVQMQTPWGPVRAKRVVLPDGSTRRKPEADDVASVARRARVPFGEVLRSAR